MVDGKICLFSIKTVNDLLLKVRSLNDEKSLMNFLHNLEDY